MGCHALLQGIFPTQGANLGLLPWQVDSLLLAAGKPALSTCEIFPLGVSLSYEILNGFVLMGQHARD